MSSSVMTCVLDAMSTGTCIGELAEHLQGLTIALVTDGVNRDLIACLMRARARPRRSAGA